VSGQGFYSYPNPAFEQPGRLSFLGRFLGRHVDEEARGFARDITRKHHEADRRRAEDGRQ
jgi:hypothetical protein